MKQCKVTVCNHSDIARFIFHILVSAPPNDLCASKDFIPGRSALSGRALKAVIGAIYRARQNTFLMKVVDRQVVVHKAAARHSNWPSMDHYRTNELNSMVNHARENKKGSGVYDQITKILAKCKADPEEGEHKE